MLCLEAERSSQIKRLDAKPLAGVTMEKRAWSSTKCLQAARPWPRAAILATTSEGPAKHYSRMPVCTLSAENSVTTRLPSS